MTRKGRSRENRRKRRKRRKKKRSKNNKKNSKTRNPKKYQYRVPRNTGKTQVTGCPGKGSNR